MQERNTNKEMRKALCVLRLGVQNKSEFELQYEYESFINDLLRKKHEADKAG